MINKFLTKILILGMFGLVAMGTVQKLEAAQNNKTQELADEEEVIVEDNDSLGSEED